MKVEHKGHTTTIKDTESSFDAFLEKERVKIYESLGFTSILIPKGNKFKRYDVAIEWSEEDKCFLAFIPYTVEFVAHGDTRVEALGNLEDLMNEFLKSEDSV